MIRFSLKCENDHNFDSWFQSTSAFDKLLANNMVSCAICGTIKVQKSVMAPQVRPARSSAKPQPEEPSPLSAPATPEEQAISDLRRKVEADSEDVGENFAKEARAIHEGDAPARAIRGEAKIKDAKELIEDGIQVAPLPWSNKGKAN